MVDGKLSKNHTIQDYREYLQKQGQNIDPYARALIGSLAGYTGYNMNQAMNATKSIKAIQNVMDTQMQNFIASIGGSSP